VSALTLSITDRAGTIYVSADAGPAPGEPGVPVARVPEQFWQGKLVIPPRATEELRAALARIREERLGDVTVYGLDRLYLQDWGCPTVVGVRGELRREPQSWPAVG
jgi:hypothetical protein